MTVNLPPQPEVQPGTCWAMDTTQGYVTIQLAMPVIIESVSLEHIPKSLSPLGRLDSAPKEFAVMVGVNDWSVDR